MYYYIIPINSFIVLPIEENIDKDTKTLILYNLVYKIMFC